MNTPNPVDVHAGNRIRQGRKMLKMSQAHLACAIGITFQQIQKYENVKNRVPVGRLAQIAAVLNIPVHDFFAGGDGNSSNPIFDTSPETRVFLTAFLKVKHAKTQESIAALVVAASAE
jgi:transcriptional regulator with XRE-family HTH domain